MDRYWVVAGGMVGAARRGFRGALLGAAAGWAIGWLLTPARRRQPLPASEHYLRYPEEEYVDALRDYGGEEETAAAAMDDLSRELPGRG